MCLWSFHTHSKPLITMKKKWKRLLIIPRPPWFLLIWIDCRFLNINKIQIRNMIMAPGHFDWFFALPINEVFFFLWEIENCEKWWLCKQGFTLGRQKTHPQVYSFPLYFILRKKMFIIWLKVYQNEEDFVLCLDPEKC